MLARTWVVGSVSALLLAAGAGCDHEDEVCARTPDEVEREPARERTAVELAVSPAPAPLPRRPVISLGFIGDEPLKPIPPAQDPPWMHFSCGQCDPDYELP